MLNRLKKIVLGKKRLICIVLISVIIGVAVPKFIYYRAVRMETEKIGGNSEVGGKWEFKKRMGGKYLLIEANVYRGDGRYRKAVRAYRNIAEKYPKVAPAALYEIARTYQLSGSRNSKKIKAYREVIQRFPDSQEAGESLEEWAKLSGNQISLYQDLIRQYPDKHIAEVALARMLNKVLAQQNKEDAQKFCLKQLAEYPVARVQIAAYKLLVLYARQSNNIQPVTDLSYRIMEDFPQTHLAEVATSALAGMNFQQGNYNESLGLWSGLEKKKSMMAEKTQPDTYPKQPKVRKAAVPERPDIYRRIENLARAGSSSPGYIKELANLFFLSGAVCDILASYSDQDSSSAFFADEANSLLRGQGDLKKNPGVSGFTAEERSLRREVLRITDGKVVTAYRKLAPTIGNGKAKDGLVKYITAYILATRSVSRVSAEMDIFLDEIPMESLLPALLGQVAETRGYQSGLNICREIISRSPQSADAAVVLENVGDLYRQMKMNAQARAVYRKIVLGYPEHPSAIKAQEKIIDVYAVNWQFYPDAINECLELARIFPGSAEAIHARFMVGRFYYLADNYDQAITTLQNFVLKYPKTEWVPEAYLLMALNYLGKQENNLAVEQLRTLIKKYPKHELAARAQFLIGYCFLSQQKYDDALREYQKLVTNYPDSFPYNEMTKQFIRRLSKMN